MALLVSQLQLWTLPWFQYVPETRSRTLVASSILYQSIASSSQLHCTIQPHGRVAMLSLPIPPESFLFLKPSSKLIWWPEDKLRDPVSSLPRRARCQRRRYPWAIQSSCMHWESTKSVSIALQEINKRVYSRPQSPPHVPQWGYSST